MKKLLYIALNELMLLLKDRMAVVWMIILPLGMTAIMGLVFGGFGGGSEAVVIDLPVVDHDGGEMAAVVLDILSQTGNLHLETEYDEETARQLVADGKRAGAVVIPSDFSAAITSGQPTALELVVVPGGQTAPLLEGMVRGVASGFSNVQTTVEVAISEVQRATGNYDLDYEGIARRVVATTLERLEDPPVRARVTTVGGTEEEEFDIFDQVVPGYAVMFAMFTVLSAAGGILEEKERGTFKRLLIAPIPQWSLLGGKLLAQFLMGVGQIALMFLFGALLFHIQLGNSLLGLLLITLATCWATTSLGILLVAVIRSRKQLHPITTLIILGTSAIGGSWFPLFLMPKAVQQVARVTLVAWAMEGYNRLMILGGSLADVWMDIGVLVLYGAVCFGVGLKLFRFKEA
ncbi:MAG: ABC transporter permease [Anaerolineae bacterium]|nr:ABC transporter permease [Anaerolineae bacterium]